MSANRQEIGDPLKQFAARRGKLGSKGRSDQSAQEDEQIYRSTEIQQRTTEDVQLDSDADAQRGVTASTQADSSEAVQRSRSTDAQMGRGEDEQHSSGTDVQTGKPVRKKTGYSLDVNLTKRAKYLAIDEGKDVNDLIEEGLRLVFEKRGIPAD